MFKRTLAAVALAATALAANPLAAREIPVPAGIAAQFVDSSPVSQPTRAHAAMQEVGENRRARRKAARHDMAAPRHRGHPRTARSHGRHRYTTHRRTVW
ncbi:MAG: hypothetical protein WA954_04715 [Parerythrobacter sp.]